MKKRLSSLTFGLFLSSTILLAQSNNPTLYNQSRNQIDQQLMIGLGSWAA